MLKRIVTTFLILIFPFTLSSCGANKGQEDTSLKLVLNKEEVELFPDETFTLSGQLKGNKKDIPSTTLISWSSADEHIADVTYLTGQITAITPGKTIITGEAINFMTSEVLATATCEVTVKKIEGFDYEIGQPNGFIRDTSYLLFNVPIKNTGNMNIYLGRGEYLITNKYGDELAESVFGMYAYPRIIAPGETGYYFYTVQSNAFEGKTINDLVITPTLTIKAAKDAKCERYSVSELTFDTSWLGYPLINGVLINNSNERIAKPVIAVHIFNTDGQFLLTKAGSFEEGINPNESKEFTLDLHGYGGDDIALSEIGKCVPIAYDNVSID